MNEKWELDRFWTIQVQQVNIWELERFWTIKVKQENIALGGTEAGMLSIWVGLFESFNWMESITYFHVRGEDLLSMYIVPSIFACKNKDNAKMLKRPNMEKNMEGQTR